MGPDEPPRDRPEDSEDQEKPVIITSKQLGPPPYVLEHKDVLQAFIPFNKRECRHIRQIDEDTLVKFGSNITLAEAEAMRFISTHTSIKTPKVIGAYILEDNGYIIMSYERGKLLPQFWEDSTTEEKEKVIEQLRRYMSEMRAIKGEYVGGFNRNACIAAEFQWDYDHKANHQYGPYPDEDGFNEGIIEAISRAYPGPPDTDTETIGYNDEYAIKQLVRCLRNHEIVFTHGDLNASNILVQDDLTVVILDWDTAGFYPEYWEWYKATWMGVFKPSYIRQVERYIPPFWVEAKIMRYIFDRILG